MPSGVFYMFHVGPVPVFGSVWFLLLVLFLSRGAGDLAGGIAFGLCVAVSVLVHELGHALVALRYRLSPQVLLTGFGGVTYHERPTSPRHAALITAAGPAAGLLLGGVCLVGWGAMAYLAPGLAEASPRLFELLGLMVIVNVIWSVFNLLPVFPMDGGQLFRLGALRVFSRPATAERVTHGVGLVFALGMLGLAVAFRQPFLGIIALLMVVDNGRRLRATEASGPIYARQHHGQELLDEAEVALEAGDAREATRLAHQARSLAGLPDDLAARACELVAVGSIRIGRVEEGLRFAARAPATPRLVAAAIEGHLARGEPDQAEALTQSEPFRRLPVGTREQLLEAVRRGA